MGLIGCPRTDQPDSRYASAMRLVVGRIYVTMLVLLYPLFGSSHMQLSLCLSMQKKKKTSDYAMEMRPKSSHLKNQARVIHSQAPVGLSHSTKWLPTYGQPIRPYMCSSH